MPSNLAHRLSRLEAQLNRPPPSVPRLVVAPIPADEWKRTVPLHQTALLARTTHTDPPHAMNIPPERLPPREARSLAAAQRRARLALARVIPFERWSVGRTASEIAFYHEHVAILTEMAGDAAPEAA